MRRIFILLALCVTLGLVSGCESQPPVSTFSVPIRDAAPIEDVMALQTLLVGDERVSDCHYESLLTEPPSPYAGGTEVADRDSRFIVSLESALEPGELTPLIESIERQSYFSRTVDGTPGTEWWK